MAIQRNTAQRDAIRVVFETEARPLSPQEVLQAARKTIGHLGQATVYRTINALVDEGWLTNVDLPGDWARYEIAGQGHHHHFACMACHKVYDLPGCCGHDHDHLPPGFAAESHAVVIYGRCQACITATKPKRVPASRIRGPNTR